MIEIAEISDDVEAARQRISDALDEHAKGFGHSFQPDLLVLEAHENGDWLGGISARMALSWMFVELLAVAKTARGKGVGSVLLDRMERVARDRDLVGIWLDTFGFQAPDFYPGRGYTEIGRVPDYPPGSARIFFQKRLS